MPVGTGRVLDGIEDAIDLVGLAVATEDVLPGNRIEFATDAGGVRLFWDMEMDSSTGLSKVRYNRLLAMV